MKYSKSYERALKQSKTVEKSETKIVHPRCTPRKTERVLAESVAVWDQPKKDAVRIAILAYCYALLRLNLSRRKMSYIFIS